MTLPDSPRRAGRPRNEDTVPAVLAVVRALVREHGFDAVTMNLIAEQAGVARQTLYRRWPGKAEIVLDAYLAGGEEIDPPTGEGLVTALSAFLCAIFRRVAADGLSIRSLIASAQADAEFMAYFRERFMVPRAKAACRILGHAVAQGKLPPDTDLDVLVDMVLGAVWYRLLTGQRLDEAYADVLVRQVTALGRLPR